MHIVIAKKYDNNTQIREMHELSTQIMYVYKKIHEMNGFVKLRAVSNLSTFLAIILK
jgi:hypothetical protein